MSRTGQVLEGSLDASPAKVGASPTPTTESNPLPPSPPHHTAETPRSPYSLQTPNSPLMLQAPSTLQTSNSHLPIAAVPLAVAGTPPTTPLDKGKRVLTISSEDEDSDVGPTYKRRRTNRIFYSRSPSPPHGGSLMNNPPSATSPSPQTVQEEGVVESVPLPTPTPTPAPAAPTPTPELMEIPPPIRQLMRGFNERLSPGEPSGVRRSEGMPYYLGPSWSSPLNGAPKQSPRLMRHAPSKPSNRKWLP